MIKPAVAVSAPGKVLLAGGYLVLDRKYTGLVFGLDARIHVYVEPLETTSGVTFSEITVRSPQFQDAVWEYGYRLAEANGGVRVTQLRVDADLKLNRNVFVETALAYALSYISTHGSGNVWPTTITILADDDYYSTPATAVSPGEKFRDFGVSLGKAHKTGLGSSAALVTAFTAALLAHYMPADTFDLSKDSSRRKLHNLAQASHCAAQGKVGSGFDVASAVFGSCLYRRFSPSILSDHDEPGHKGFANELRHIVDEDGKVGPWDTEFTKGAIKVPDGIRLVMCDVSCGSQTPGMVRQVLAWRQKEYEDSDALWAELQKANQGLAAELVNLADTKSTDYARLQTCIAGIRRHIRDMGRRSGVAIEPPAQTRLLDACSNVQGVIGGVVPGAGGYDAVALLIEDKPEVLQALSKLFEGWEPGEPDNNADTVSKVSILGVREEMEGVRTENHKLYKGWVG